MRRESAGIAPWQRTEALVPEISERLDALVSARRILLNLRIDVREMAYIDVGLVMPVPMPLSASTVETMSPMPISALSSSIDFMLTRPCWDGSDPQPLVGFLPD